MDEEEVTLNALDYKIWTQLISKSIKTTVEAWFYADEHDLHAREYHRKMEARWKEIAR